jgi:hypothetical protein
MFDEREPRYTSTSRHKHQKQWWELPQEDKDAILGLPNFDKEIFLEITGINIDCNQPSECNCECTTCKN